MFPDVIIYPSYADTHSSVLDDIRDLFISRRLIHYAGSLQERCQLDEAALEKAVQKALVVCVTAGISPEEHFKSVFVYAGDALKKDWLVSDLGLQLITLNADITNPVVARLQVELLSGRGL
ncbi:hypothetical protein HB364_16030 [Pseudoflavitalea sp. X16]|uniref:hypothetical protein n=1 Tax=Paraflavitalea devenefica TaxID=2716334 RepID=UPI00141D84FC|nr:hypothetical protein [Paraflavitalea devenefica]NII26598.1 hypothetical protein [Paraflavitalea devenefica]